MVKQRGMKLITESKIDEGEEIEYEYKEINSINSGKLEEADSFEEYMNQNPRILFPNEIIRKFLSYSKKRYKKFQRVNWGDLLNEENYESEVEKYIESCAEGLLLFIDFMNKQGDTKPNQASKKTDSEAPLDFKTLKK